MYSTGIRRRRFKSLSVGLLGNHRTTQLRILTLSKTHHRHQQAILYKFPEMQRLSKPQSGLRRQMLSGRLITMPKYRMGILRFPFPPEHHQPFPQVLLMENLRAHVAHSHRSSMCLNRHHLAHIVFAHGVTRVPQNDCMSTTVFLSLETAVPGSDGDGGPIGYSLHLGHFSQRFFRH